MRALRRAVHVTFFQGGIVGTDFNFYGPRVSGLGRYLAAVVPNADRFELHPLIRGEAATALQGLRNATYLQIRVHPDYVDAVSGANESRGAAFRAQRDLGDAKSYELVWRRRGRRGRDGLLASLLRLAQRNDLREGALKFVVKGVLEETDRIATVDLLRDQLHIDQAHISTKCSKSSASAGVGVRGDSRGAHRTARPASGCNDGYEVIQGCTEFLRR